MKLLGKEDVETQASQWAVDEAQKKASDACVP
jgi:hypothetical protein